MSCGFFNGGICAAGKFGGRPTSEHCQACMTGRLQARRDALAGKPEPAANGGGGCGGCGGGPMPRTPEQADQMLRG